MVVERPRNPEHGDYATNVALQAAKKVGASPRELAAWLVDSLATNPAIESAEVAGPGFINIRLAADAQGQIVAEILRAGENYGHSDGHAGTVVNLEFVSAIAPQAPSTLEARAGLQWEIHLGVF